MALDHIAEWLDDWVDANLRTSGHRPLPGDMAAEADRCRADADAAGVAGADLATVAGGDLERYLLERRNAFADADVRRQAESEERNRRDAEAKRMPRL